MILRTRPVPVFAQLGASPQERVRVARLKNRSMINAFKMGVKYGVAFAALLALSGCVSVPGDAVRGSRNDRCSVSVDGSATVRFSDDCVLVSSTGEVSFVRIKWPRELLRETLVLNDAWERSYGDLEWKSLAETRVSPWYFLASVSNRTWGVGVETGPGAMCCWEVTTNGTTLVLDLRAGGRSRHAGSCALNRGKASQLGISGGASAR